MNSLVQSFYNWYKATIRHPKYRWVLIGGTLLYLVSPIDISPDFIPILGWIDDGIIATLLVAEVSQLLLESLKRNQANTSDAPTANTQPTIDVDAY